MISGGSKLSKRKSNVANASTYRKCSSLTSSSTLDVESVKDLAVSDGGVSKLRRVEADQKGFHGKLKAKGAKSASKPKANESPKSNSADKHGSPPSKPKPNPKLAASGKPGSSLKKRLSIRKKKKTKKDLIEEQKFETMRKSDRKKFWQKLNRKDFDLKMSAKRIWEKMRRFSTPDDERRQLCEKLMQLVEGKVESLLHSHDTSRVVECMIQYGTNQQRQLIFDEVKDRVLEMSKEKFAKFIVRKFLKYGAPEQKAHIMLQFAAAGVSKLLRHAEVGSIVEYAYNDFANASQRAMFSRSFYGPTAQLLDVPRDATLERISKLVPPHQTEQIVCNMSELITPLLEKTALEYSLTHHALFEFMQVARGQFRVDMIENLKEKLLPIVHTRDGAHAAMNCIWHGTVKDRKAILKSFRGHVVKVANDRYGHFVLLAVFDAFDDTTLVDKIIIKELNAKLGDVVESPFGRKVLLYLLRRRDPLHFHPDIVTILLQGDENATSKKDVETRANELLKFASPGLLNHVKQHCAELCSDPKTVLFVAEVLKYAHGDGAVDAMKAVAEWVCAYEGVEGDNSLVTALKSVVTHARTAAASQDGEGGAHFADVLAVCVSDETVQRWATSNRGCFVLNMLTDSATGDSRTKLTTLIRAHLRVVKRALSSHSQGVTLLEKLQAAA